MTVKEYLRQLEGEEVIVEGKELPSVGVDHCVARQPLLLNEPLDHLKVAWEKYDVNLVKQCLERSRFQIEEEPSHRSQLQPPIPGPPPTCP